MLEEGLGIGFSPSSIARRICPDTACIVPLNEEINRTLYYVTLRELLDYPSVQSFSSYVQHYVFT